MLKDFTTQQLVDELASRYDNSILSLLYLELSHVVNAKTQKELALEKEIENLKEKRGSKN